MEKKSNENLDEQVVFMMEMLKKSKEKEAKKQKDLYASMNNLEIVRN